MAPAKVEGSNPPGMDLEPSWNDGLEKIEQPTKHRKMSYICHAQLPLKRIEATQYQTLSNEISLTRSSTQEFVLMSDNAGLGSFREDPNSCTVSPAHANQCRHGGQNTHAMPMIPRIAPSDEICSRSWTYGKRTGINTYMHSLTTWSGRLPSENQHFCDHDSRLSGAVLPVLLFKRAIR